MEWREVVGYEGIYQVSDQGDVRRSGQARGARPGRLLAQAPHAHGYRVVSLWHGNKERSFLTHRLVAHAFLGPAPSGKEVNHRDGVKHHNEVGNLEYLTRSQNIAHARDTGLNDMRGTGNAASKLTDDQVRAIRRRHANNEFGYKMLGRAYDVSWEAIRDIVKGRTWKHLLT